MPLRQQAGDAASLSAYQCHVSRDRPKVSVMNEMAGDNASVTRTVRWKMSPMKGEIL
jgi:hypothetical protein